MSQRHTQLPGEKVATTAHAPAQKAPEGQEAAQRDLERLAEQASSASEMDTETAARVGAQLGNSALAALIAERAARGGGQQSEGEDEEEELEQGSEEDAADQAVESSLPSFSGGAGPAGGGAGAGLEQAPWDVGPMFGGDDDDAGFDGHPSWRPLPVPVDPDGDDDEDVDLEEVDPDDAAEGTAPALDHEAATDALGEATWTPTLLTRGLRHPQRIARVPFDAEALVDTDASSHALGRLRAVARFAARHADEDGARALARVASVAGEAVFPEAGGMAGATARAACVAEALLERLGPAWPQVFEVALDGRARPWAEQAALALSTDGALGAPALFVKALGASGLRPGDLPPRAGAMPAAVHALAVAARLRPVPQVDRCLAPTPPPLPDDPLAAIDAVLAVFTDASPPEAPDGIVAPDDVRALLAQVDRLLSGIGVVQVELAAAALACAPFVDVTRALAVLRRASITLRDAARRAFAAGERVEWCVGTDDAPGLRSAARDAQSARERAARARDAALQRLGWLLSQAAEAAPRPVPPAADVGALDEAAQAFAHGRPEDAQGPLARASALPGGLGRASSSLLAGLHLSRGAWDAALDLGTAQLGVGVDAEAPFAVADAAITVAAASEDWRAPLSVAADYLRAVDAGGALNLLRARWAEESATRAD